jgi:hypothetical protein
MTNAIKVLLQMQKTTLHLQQHNTQQQQQVCLCNLYRVYFKTVLIWKIFNPSYDFLVPLCLYLVQKYEKNAVK